MFFKRKELKEKIENYRKAFENLEEDRKDLQDRIDFNINEKNKYEKLNEELNSKLKELNSKITSFKIKDVLRTLKFNKLEAGNLFISQREYNDLESERDFIKVKWDVKEGSIGKIYDIPVKVDSSVVEFFISIKPKISIESADKSPYQFVMDEAKNLKLTKFQLEYLTKFMKKSQKSISPKPKKVKSRKR